MKFVLVELRMGESRAAVRVIQLWPIQMRLILYPRISPGQPGIPVGHRLGWQNPVHCGKGSQKAPRL